MIYGVEQSTDMRAPQTVVRRFRGRRAAERWAKGAGGYTHGDPEAARNWHHTFRSIYEMPPGWRPPLAPALDKAARDGSTPTYPRNRADALANRIHRDGTPCR